MPRPSPQQWIAEQDRYARTRRSHFRMAAEAVARAFVELQQVQAVALFGSVAAPARTDISRRGWELLHNSKDVDLAVWVDRLDDLAALNRARSRALAKLFREQSVGVAHHQVDVFLMEPQTNRYLGRLCTFASCPKGKPQCAVPGCGREPLLRQHEDFELDLDALADDRIVWLFNRHGIEP